MTGGIRSFLLDSSVIVKWLRTETDSDKALAIQAEFMSGGLDIHISELTLYETANALRYSGESTGDEVCVCLDSIVTLGITAYPFDWDVLMSGIDVSFEKELSIYDAYLFALAKTYGLTLVTADARLFANLKGDGGVLQLRSWPLVH